MKKKPELDILRFIYNFNLTKGYSPTLREITQATEFKSPASIHKFLNILHDKGYITKPTIKPRTLEITEKGLHEINVFTNSIKDPKTILLRNGQSLNDYFPIPNKIHMSYNTDSLLLIKVSSNNMKNAGILKGDYIIVDKSEKLKNNDTVVALVKNNGPNCFKYVKNDDSVQLYSKDGLTSPISHNYEIIGKAISLYRTDFS